MPPAPLPDNEHARLAAMRAYCGLDGLREDWCDEIAAIAASISGCPIAIASIVESERQWFKGVVGLDLEETPRDVAFCAYTILNREPMIVQDATSDPRFADNPLVTGPMAVRFYAGVPLVMPDGHAAGSLCVIDTRPRALDDAALATLRRLARLIVDRVAQRRDLSGERDGRRRAEQRLAELRLAQTALRDEIRRRDALEAHLAQALTRADAAERLARDQQHALDTAGIVAVTDRAGTILHVNDNFCRISGYERPELLGRNHRILNSGHHEKAFFKSMYACIGAGKPWRGEVCNRAKDGSLYWVDTTIVPLLDASGRPEKYIALRIDVTERKRAEAELRRTSEALESFFTTAIDLLCIADFAGRFVRVNPVWGTLLGVDAADLPGRRFIDFVHPDDVDATETTMRALHVGGSVEGFRNRYRAADGSYRTLEWRSRATGGLIYAAARDVTSQIEHERTLIAAREAAEDASRAKSDFLANMSHEIRTPMTAILGFADVLDRARGELDEDQQRDAVRTIRRNGEHLLEIINDVLDVSRIEAGKMSLDRTPCRLAEVVADAAGMLRERAEAKGLGLEVVVAPDAPARVCADPLRLRQVLINLVGNAVKFTSEGSITVRVNAAGDGRVALEIEDTGIGMTDEQRRRVEAFDPFTQADTSTTRRYGGTGLGLRVSAGLVRLHGGALTIRSRPGVGTTVRIELPVGEVPNVDAAAAGNAPRAFAGATRLTGLRVLLAEDGPDNQRLITWHLRRAGADVTVAENGLVALDRLAEAESQRRPFDVVLMDMQMPEMDGYTATAEIRRRPHAPPVIALTAHAMVGDAARCFAAGCVEYLTKPIQPDRLTAAIAQIARELRSAA